MNKVYIYLSVAIAITVSTISILLYSFSSTGVVFVDTTVIYDNFNLSKELNTELESTIKKKKLQLDSLYSSLMVMERDLKNNHNSNEELVRVADMEQEYIRQKKNFEKEQEELLFNCNSKIWNQINSYIDDFGNEKGYSLILGATGQGGIMYGEKKVNITEEFLKYINTRYDVK